MDEVKRKRKDGFTQEDVDIALSDLRKYVAGKYSIDNKATQNQEWWRLRHMDYADMDDEDKADRARSVSAWAVNSILNKHADIMDSLPKPNILPREADDEPEAEILTSIAPVILEQNDYEKVYRNIGWDFCIDGGAITSVLWDTTKRDGLGDVSINNVDVHNLFWKPGVEDIQDSPRLYLVTLEEIDSVRARFPKLNQDEIGPQDTGMITKYLHDDNIDTSNCVEVINMYYKKNVSLTASVDTTDENGNAAAVEIQVPKTYLHLAIIVGNQLAFCSENEPGYEEGFYHHGRYPFVLRRAFPVKDTPWGFGYLDIMKNPQLYIDAMDDDIIRIADMKARPRFWAKKNANINMDDFANWNKQIIEVGGGGELGESIRQVDIYDVPAGIMEHRANKIEELKETSGNRDFNQGGVSGGITAASAVAALQEAGSKLSRDMNKELYRGAREEYNLVIELIRQFYTEPRSFRIDSENGDYRFVQYSNAGIVDKDTLLPDGTVRHKRPMFDVSVSAEKASPFSRAAQNETAKELYELGLFAPENAVAALVCIDMMDFEGKPKVKKQIEDNAVMLQQFQAAMMLIQQKAMIDPAFAQVAMQQGLIDPEQMAAMMAQGQPQQNGPASRNEGTAEDRAARNISRTDGSQATKARLRAANTAIPR